MYKQLNDTVVENEERKNNPALQDGIASQLLNAYAVGVLAIKGKESELANIISYHIFDLLDWVRKNQLDIQASLARLAAAQSGYDSVNGALSTGFPSNIQDLEALVDEKFCSGSCPMDVVGLSREMIEREALC